MRTTLTLDDDVARLIEEQVHRTRRLLPGGAEFSLTVYGMRTDLKMKVFEWQRESLSLHAANCRRMFRCWRRLLERRSDLRRRR